MFDCFIMDSIGFVPLKKI